MAFQQIFRHSCNQGGCCPRNRCLGASLQFMMFKHVILNGMHQVCMHPHHMIRNASWVGCAVVTKSIAAL